MINNSDYIIIKNTLVRYKGHDPFVEIPDGVTCIAKEAFCYQDIRTVNMPDTVTVIDDQAFYRCEELFEINLSDNLIRIGRDAFEGCGRLASLELPSGLETIGNGAFSNCWELTSVELPITVQSIGSRAFTSTKITEIHIPDQIRAIDTEAFGHCMELTSVSLPKNLEEIGPRAFYGCRKLSEISFPSSLQCIGEDAFGGCKGIMNKDGFVIINNILTSYFGNDRVVRIPEGVQKINAGVFEQLHRIRIVILPESVTEIEQRAFYRCNCLCDINISESVKEISSTAFADCNRLADENGFVIFNGKLFGYYGHQSKLVIPEGVTVIGSMAFANDYHKSLEEVILPESVDVIEDNAFSFCYNLKTIRMPKMMKFIGESAFEYCNKLESIRVPDGIEALHYRTFYGCSKLRKIELPKTLKKIHHFAISECTALEDISIPETVMSFENADLKGVRMTISRLGREFRVNLKHRWDGKDEQLLWDMLNAPSLVTFNAIKTISYKVALAERLYPEYEEYGPYLKRNMKKAIKDAIEFDDKRLLESLRSTNLIDQDKFDAWAAVAQEEMTQKVVETERMLQACYERTTVIERKQVESKYQKAMETMEEDGGRVPINLNNAIKAFYEIHDYKDADAMIRECRHRIDEFIVEKREKKYQEALLLYGKGDGRNRDELEEAIDLLEGVSDYKNSSAILRDYYKKYWGIDIAERG